MARETKNRWDRAERDLGLLSALLSIHDLDSPMQAIVLLAIKVQFTLTGYVTMRHITDTFDYPEKGLLIMLGKLKAKGFILKGKEFITITDAGRKEIWRLHGRRASVYDRVKKAGQVRKEENFKWK